MKINWKQKLSSRKFWAAAASAIVGILGAFHFSEDVIAQASVIVATIGGLAVYMLAEAKVDAGRSETPADKEDAA